MDIRNDYVRSGATFILKLWFESDAGKRAGMHLAVSDEICFSADGDMQAGVVYLYPDQVGDDILAGGRSVFSAGNLDELCDLLARAATIEGWRDRKAEYNRYRQKFCGRTFAIDGKLKYYHTHKELAAKIEQLGGTVSGTVSSDIDYLICNNGESQSRKVVKARNLGIPIISDRDFAWGLFGDQLEETEEDGDDEGMTVAVADAAPITVGNFKDACAEAGITLGNLKKITIQNNKFGTKDSAMFIFCDNDRFLEYKKLYRDAPEEQKPEIAEAFLSFVKAGPELGVCDNELALPDIMPCIWNCGDELLEQTMGAYLEGDDPGHWMGTYSMEFTVDMAERTVTSREVIFYGDI